MYYFDYTATTPVDEEVLETYNLVSRKYWGNASSHYELGSVANSLLEKAKQEVLSLFNLKNHDVIYTSGATEANNIAIYGIANNYLGQKKHLITTAIEHPSVFSCYEDLQKKGSEVTYLDVDQNGLISLDQLEKAITGDTVLVSIMWVNNILGSIQPIKGIIEVLKKYPRIRLHVDMVQGMGKIIPDFDFNDIDLFTFSAHKLNGLKGQGAVIYNKNIQLNPIIRGAGQQGGIKPGTLDVAGASACTKALKKSYLETKNHFEKVSMLYQYLRESIAGIPNIVINSGNFNNSPYILSISFINKNSETVLHFLEQYDIYVSAGSACSSKSRKPERCVLAVSHEEGRALSAVRISLSYRTTKEEIDFLIDKLRIMALKE
jgi:cysteine desulfurase